jgi:hypothetical protein
MAEITRRRCGELLRKLFEILKQAPEGLAARSALDQLARSVQHLKTTSVYAHARPGESSGRYLKTK